MTQLTLDFSPRDHQVTAAECPRLGRQCRAIYERLKEGVATNDELSRIARKYTGRISDIRAAIEPHGETIVVQDRNHETGLVVYALVTCKPVARPTLDAVVNAEFVEAVRAKIGGEFAGDARQYQAVILEAVRRGWLSPKSIVMPTQE